MLVDLFPRKIYFSAIFYFHFSEDPCFSDEFQALNKHNSHCMSLCCLGDRLIWQPPREWQTQEPIPACLNQATPVTTLFWLCKFKPDSYFPCHKSKRYVRQRQFFPVVINNRGMSPSLQLSQRGAHFCLTFRPGTFVYRKKQQQVKQLRATNIFQLASEMSLILKGRNSSAGSMLGLLSCMMQRRGFDPPLCLQ